MSVFRRGAKWYASVTFPGRRRVKRAAGSWADAKRLEQEIRASGAPAQHGLDDALVAFLKGPARALRAPSAAVTVAKAVRPYVEGKALHEAPQVAAAMVRDWSGTLAVATINRRLALLRRLCNLAWEWGWTEHPTGRRIKLLPGENTRHVYLTAAQVAALAQAAQHPGVADCIALAAYTGLRRGELLRLTAADYRDGYLWIDTRSKTARPRAVPVVEHVRGIASRLPLLVTESVLRERFEAARAAIGMPGLHFHDLRHTCASLLVQAGVPLRVIGEILGHSTPAMTARYAHLAPQHLADAMHAAFGASQVRPKAKRRAGGTGGK